VAVTLTGPTALIARCQPDGTWLTAADQWGAVLRPRRGPSSSIGNQPKKTSASA
jgi:hypothetical protein